jgi:hypothetical protein
MKTLLKVVWKFLIICSRLALLIAIFILIINVFNIPTEDAIVVAVAVFLGSTFAAAIFPGPLGLILGFPAVVVVWAFGSKLEL